MQLLQIPGQEDQVLQQVIMQEIRDADLLCFSGLQQALAIAAEIMHLALIMVNLLLIVLIFVS
ncbi:hypothetical protein D3C75_1296700 [compost metagenome]